MRWTQANRHEPPKERGYYIVKVRQGNSQQFPFSPYVIVKIGKVPTWGKTIEKFQWDPTWYCIIEEIDEMRNVGPKGPSVFQKELTYEERKMLK